MDTSKFTSGKFWLTIICGLVFAYCSINKILPQDKVYDVILVVVYAYFTKNSIQNGKGTPNV